jgi:hypothetical protein
MLKEYVDLVSKREFVSVIGDKIKYRYDPRGFVNLLAFQKMPNIAKRHFYPNKAKTHIITIS